MRGRHSLKHFSSTQQTIALSSGEAELRGIVKGGAEGLGLQHVGEDLNIEYDVHIHIYIYRIKCRHGEWLLGKA